MFVAMLVTWEYPHYVLTSEDYVGWKVASTFISAVVAFWHGGSQIDKLMSLRKQATNE